MEWGVCQEANIQIRNISEPMEFGELRKTESCLVRSEHPQMRTGLTKSASASKDASLLDVYRISLPRVVLNMFPAKPGERCCKCRRLGTCYGGILNLPYSPLKSAG